MYKTHINEYEIFYRVLAYGKHSKHITYLSYYSQKVIVMLEMKLHMIS